MKYEVVLPGRPPGGVEVAARKMAEAFGISEAKAAGLLRRAPGALTKGIGEREAVRVAYRLRKLGLAVEVRPVDAQPAAAAVGRGARADGSASSAARGESPPPGAAATSTAARSPFLSQVDEAPPPIPGLDVAPSSAPGDRRHGERRRGAHAGRTASERPTPPREAQRTRANRAEAPRAEAQRAEAPRAEAPRAEAPRTEAPRSEAPRSGAPASGSGRAEAQTHPERAAAMQPTAQPETAAGDRTPTDGVGLRGAPGPTASGAGHVSAPHHTAERTGERPARAVDAPRAVRSPFRRHLLLTAALPGLLAFAAMAGVWVLAPGRSFAVAFAVGILVLTITGGGMWLAGRPLLREHDRVLAETVRISRGDLARPVVASDRYPEAVQALERIRVSLQEGLERLRRRKR